MLLFQLAQALCQIAQQNLAADCLGKNSRSLTEGAHHYPWLLSCCITSQCSDFFCKRIYLWYLPADLLADLSSSQILAQADLAECNSPLKIVQIGGDDLFENDETGANDFLLDPEGGLA